MNPTTETTARVSVPGVPLSGQPAPRIPIVAFGMSLGLFLVISYVLCIALYLLFPDLVIEHAMLSLFLPGFELLDWPNFFLGLVESFGYGWYVALVFAPLYNVFAARRR
jgi:hypothetical protein